MKSRLTGIFVAVGLMTGSAQAAEIKVLAVGAFMETFKELVPEFEKATGHKVAADYAASPQLMKQIEGGAPFDLAILQDTAVNDPVNQKFFAAGARPTLSSVGLGAAVKAGAPKPDIGSVDAFKQTLIKAKSVTIQPESANGQHFLAVFQKLGIGDDMKPKLKLVKAPTEAALAVANGEAEMALFLSNLLIGVRGVDYLGPVPAEFQQQFVFVAAVGANAKEPEAAKALIQRLTTPAAAAVMKKNGMQAP